MIRMIQSSSAEHAKAYFSDALLKTDYYLNDQELQGKHHGRLAERLGLDKTVNKESFFSLVENIHPHTGKQLTQRNKEERTIGYDINFHCPKSVSVLHALSNDNHILDAFQSSVTDTMKDIEADSKTRVRKGGKYEDRTTGELIWADFVHQTARPVGDDLPDPHLHSHCFVFNATWDDMEKRFKAGQFRDIKMDMPYYQARFHKRLADKMATLGYGIKRTNTSFEIEGVPQKVIDQFSKRTDEIGRVAKEKGITDAKGLDALGAKTRSKKQKGVSMAELKKEWKRQMWDWTKEDESGKQTSIRYAPDKEQSRATPEQVLEHAQKHSFERASVVADRRLLATAYRYALGHSSASIKDITQAFDADNRFIHVREKGRSLCTTREILKEEKRMVDLAKQGQSRLVPLYQTAPDIQLKEEQGEAIRHVLTTSNLVSIVRGAAGTGKTKLMTEAIDWMEKAGKKVTVVAPTAQASRGVLKEEGFKNAETVAKLLVDKKLQEDLKNGVLWVDEAGLLGTRDMSSLLEVATRQNARLILGGDTRQHASVVRGDALRILNTIGGIRAAEVSKIRRQKNEAYKTAVENLSKGNVESGFKQLDDIGFIKEIDPLKPNEQLVDDYVKFLKKGQSALVISPTHTQGDEVTHAIRQKLRQAEIIGKKEILAKRLSNRNLTGAEKEDYRNFSEGEVIQFNQHVKGFRRGSTWKVKSIGENELSLQDNTGSIKGLSLNKSAAFDVFDEKEIALAKGDKIQITRNGFDKHEKRLNNGQTLNVMAVTKGGKILLKNSISKCSYEVDKDFGHLSHAHCITSYASQGKTVQHVLIAQPSSTFPATDAKQFYVSVSRAEHSASVYTDDKQALLAHASEIGDRQSAMELVSKKQTHQEHVVDRLRAEPEKKTKAAKERNTVARTTPSRDKDYEPRV